MRPDISKTRSQQYTDVVERASVALDGNNLELALNCINAAQWVKYDLERQAGWESVAYRYDNDECTDEYGD